MHKLDLEKARVTGDQIASICWISEKGNSRKIKKKKIYFYFIAYAKAFVWSQQTVENS